MVKLVESAVKPPPGVNGGAVPIESVADILNRELKHVIEEWLTACGGTQKFDFVT